MMAPPRPAPARWSFSLPLLLQRLFAMKIAFHLAGLPPVRALVLPPYARTGRPGGPAVKLHAKYTHLRSAVVFGGMDMKPRRWSSKKVEVLVATPGRLLTTLKPRTPCSTRSSMWCSDEADRMLDIGTTARPAAHPELPAEGAHDAAVQCHLLARDQAPGQQLPQNPVTIEVARSNATASTGGAAFLQRR